jgi:uncharacterized RDD family membrane protein YckC
MYATVCLDMTHMDRHGPQPRIGLRVWTYLIDFETVWMYVGLFYLGALAFWSYSFSIWV